MAVEVGLLLLLTITCCLWHLVLCWETALLGRLHVSGRLGHEALEAGLLREPTHLLLLLLELLLLLQTLQTLAWRCLVSCQLRL